MTLLDRVLSATPTERRSLALIASELRTLRQMAEVAFDHLKWELPVTRKQADKQREVAAELDKIPIPDEEELIDQHITRVMLKISEGVDDEETRELLKTLG